MKVGKGHIPALDGLRALAIGLVVLDHSLLHFIGGGIGVNIFFVLSGYLITTLLARERDRTGAISLKMFYGRRVLRLYPALLTMLIVTVLLGCGAKFALIAATYTTDVYNVITAKPIGAYEHTWSLAMEEHFYLLWPLALAVAITRRRAVWVLAVAAVASAAAAWVGTQAMGQHVNGAELFNPLWQAHGLIIGCALALLLRNGIRVPRPTAALAAGTVLALGVAVLASAVNSIRIAAAWNLVAELGAAMIIAGIVAGGQSGWYRSRLAVWVGERSYGIYLWHMPLIWLGLHYSIGPATISRVVGPAVFMVPASVLVAAISYRWVEQPFLRMKDRLNPTRVATTAPKLAIDESVSA